MGIGGTMVTFAERVRDVFTTDVAVTVTTAPDGIEDGAVYVMAPPSSLLERVPHAPGLAQVIE